MLLATPAIRAFKAARPSDELHVLVEGRCAEVLAANPHVDRLLVLPPKAGLGATLRLVRELRAARYAAAVDFKQSPRSALLARLSGARERVSWAHRRLLRRALYTSFVELLPEPAYQARQKLRLLGPLGVTSDDVRLDFPVAPAAEAEADRLLAACGLAEPGARFVACSPACVESRRRWPVERYAALADALGERHDLPTLLLWGPGEREVAEAVRAAMRAPERARIPDGFPSIPGLKAVLARARLFVGANSGPLHLAVAAGRPTLGVFGPGTPGSWLPLGEPGVLCAAAAADAAALAARLGRAPEREEFIRSIEVEPVLALAEGLLQEKEQDL